MARDRWFGKVRRKTLAHVRRFLPEMQTRVSMLDFSLAIRHFLSSGICLDG